MSFKIKKMNRLCLAILICIFSFSASAQSVKLLNSGSKASLRGLSVVSDEVVWVSGSAGSVGRSVDGGETWNWTTVKGFEKADFRDIEAFDKNTAIIMGIADPAYILKTTDGGQNWKVVFKDTTKGMFLDAMEFWNEQSGIVIGDPLGDKIFIARTFDGGENWQGIPAANIPAADKGEAFFASSGTNVRKLSKQEAVFVSGGLRARLFIRDKKIDLPLIQGKESTGANSIAVKNKKCLVIVGGDFNAKDDTTKNCVLTSDGGKSFTTPVSGPHGYRSCVEYLGKKNWISCGLNGVDYSTDEGKNWEWISKDSFHAVRKAKKGKAVYFSGGGGRIGKLVLKEN
ncbi:MAG: oxidoreductase [Chitinophagaceae bacterium]|nr:oxidoreductase [Chitinophagaceae bacterium]